ncbi:hypothetical protein CYY_010264, partial [Polysphondylium violaceum]
TKKMKKYYILYEQGDDYTDNEQSEEEQVNDSIESPKDESCSDSENEDPREEENDKQANTAERLLYAIQSSDLKSIKECLDKIDDANLKESPISDDANRTLLHEAAERDNVKVFKLVYQGKDDINGYSNREDISTHDELIKKDANNNTILSIAINNQNWDLCDYLHSENINEATLNQLYNHLDNEEQLKQLVDNLLNKGGKRFLPHLLKYSCDLMKNIADSDTLYEEADNNLRAQIYYILSQWEEENGSNKLVQAIKYIEEAIKLDISAKDKKLYIAYYAALLLASGISKRNSKPNLLYLLTMSIP